jgi:hypothetical protein
MKLTNVHKIPETFVNVLKRPTYSKGKANLSATQLLNSPKIVALTKKFEEELEQDVSDMVWSIFGTAIHGVLEHGKDDNHIVEERLHAEVGGWNISGAVDLQIVTGENVISIRDYKTTSAWAVMNEKIEWEQQLNIYAWLVERNKRVVVDSLGIVAIIRDWSRREAAKNEDYPQAPVKELPIKLWPYKSAKSLLRAGLWLTPRLSLPWMLMKPCRIARPRRCGRSLPSGLFARLAMYEPSHYTTRKRRPTLRLRLPAKDLKLSIDQGRERAAPASVLLVIGANNGATFRSNNECLQKTTGR